MTNSVVVVTVTYNSSGVLGSFLDSLGGSTTQNVSTIVVDNASADIEKVRLLTERPGVRLLELGENRGYGGGIVAGVDDSAEEFVLICNPDIVLFPGAVNTLLETARAHPEAGSLGPRILDSTGVIYPSARNLPSLRTGIGHAIFGQVWPTNPWTTSYKSAIAESNIIQPAGWLSGSCVLVRRSAFDSVGGFDPHYFMYFEDVDLGAKLGRANWVNLYVPTAVVTHTGAHSTSQSSQRMGRTHHDSAYRYLSRKYSGWHLAPLRLVLRVGLAARSWWSTR